MSQSAVSSQDVLVRTQPTPNPYALKFVVNMSIKREGKATFSAQVEAEGVPLAYSLFDIEGVKQVHFFQNTLTVTHSGELTSDELREQAVSVIKTRMPVHDAEFITQDELAKKKKVDRTGLSPELQEVEEILDRTIRPGLQADGGDIEVVRFENSELHIMYQGACGGCPSAMMGTLDAIQNIMSHELQTEIRVVPI